jgi:hypothetical protein
MMFDDDYYRIEDAAHTLGINPQQLMRMAAKGVVEVCVVFSNRPDGRFSKFNIDEIVPSREDEFDERLYGEVVQMLTTNFLIGGKSVPLTHEAFNKFEADTPYIAFITKDLVKIQTSTPGIYNEANCQMVACPILMRQEDRQHVYVPPYNLRLVTHKEFVITLKELDRLKALKAQQDGKPTAEELQQQLDQAVILP